ncbi:MAG: SDR family oxidoreductase, partial [Gallionella sp.]
MLITGGASGIGLAFAEAFLDAGSTVIICGRRAKRLDEVHESHPRIHWRVCDISGERDREELADWIAANFPGLNILVNNAGIQRDIDFTHGIDDFMAGENEIRINLEASIVLTGLFIPHLARNKGAAIINVSSGLGFVPAAHMPVYSATKAGMHAFSMALRHQLSGIGIRVFEIVPPAVDTELNAAGRAARGNYKPGLSPKTFVSAVMKQLENDVFEIGYGMTAGFIHASRAELDESFKQMNS